MGRVVLFTLMKYFVTIQPGKVIISIISNSSERYELQMCSQEPGKNGEACFFCNVRWPGSIGFVLVMLQSLMEEDELFSLEMVILLAVKSFGLVMVTLSYCILVYKRLESISMSIH